MTRGRQALDFYEAVGPDADTYGNHDFDHGPEAMRRIVDASSFPWVCANAVLDGDPFAAAEGTTP